MFPRAFLLVTLAALPASAVVNQAAAQQATTPAVITACVSKTTGVTRVVPSAASCSTAETVLTWNQAGPVGPVGPAGMDGAAGPMGPSGPTGPQGKTAANGFFATATIPTTVTSATPAVVSAFSGAMTAAPTTDDQGTYSMQQMLPATCTSATLTAQLDPNLGKVKSGVPGAPQGQATVSTYLPPNPKLGIDQARITPVVECTLDFFSKLGCTTPAFAPQADTTYLVTFTYLDGEVSKKNPKGTPALQMVAGRNYYTQLSCQQ